MNKKPQILLIAIGVLVILSNLIGLGNIIEYSRARFILQEICLIASAVLFIPLIINLIKNKNAAKQNGDKK